MWVKNTKRYKEQVQAIGIASAGGGEGGSCLGEGIQGRHGILVAGRPGPALHDHDSGSVYPQDEEAAIQQALKALSALRVVRWLLAVVTPML